MKLFGMPIIEDDSIETPAIELAPVRFMEPILTTDTEITEAVARWLDEHTKWPTEPERVARFVYSDGTGGSVVARRDNGSFEHNTKGIGDVFIYRLHAPDRVAAVIFTPEFFRDCAVPVIPLLHRDCGNELRRP